MKVFYKMVKIAFHDMSLSVRGSSIAVYDYAHYNETILLNSSIIIIPYSDNNDPVVLKKILLPFPSLLLQHPGRTREYPDTRKM